MFIIILYCPYFCVYKSILTPDNIKLEERIKVIKKEISITNAKKESLKNTKNIFKRYKCIDKLSLEIVNDFIDKVLVGTYDEQTNTREIKIIWNFSI